MNKRISTFARRIGLFLVLAVVMLGISGFACAGTGPDPAGAPKTERGTISAHGNELKAANNASAALRKSKGGQRSTTNDDRLAAAKRNAARKAAAAKAAGRRP